MDTSTKVIIGAVVVAGVGYGVYKYVNKDTFTGVETVPLNTNNNTTIQQFKKLKTGLTQHIHK